MIFRYNIEETIIIKDFLKKIKLPSNVITDVKERGQLLVNDQTVSNCYLMNPGDLLEIVFPATHQGENILSVKGDFEIVYEDSYLLVINKESGIATIPTRKHYTNSFSSSHGLRLLGDEMHILYTYFYVSRPMGLLVFPRFDTVTS
jgi:23S rRNA pseudouridine1911/1915/1917 synthase